MLKHLANPPNWLTAASLLLSLTALRLLHTSALGVACGLVVFCGVLDLLDGRVARWLGRTTGFGRQLDTVVDMVAFGVVPAAILWSSGSAASDGVLAEIVPLLYALAAAFRLARFSATAKTDSIWWRGLPTTMAGGTLASVVWATDLGLVPLNGDHLLALGTGFAVLMVSAVPYRTLRDLSTDGWSRGLALGLAVIFVSGLVWHPVASWALAGMAYVGLGVAEAVWRGFLGRRKSQPSSSSSSMPRSSSKASCHSSAS